MRDRPTFGWSISEVSRRTGIPTTTLRFYEKELPGLLPIRKTRGGHRRYGPSDVARLELVRRLTAEEGVTLAQVRAILTSRGDYQPLREEIERLSEQLGRQSDAIEDLSRRLASLEEQFEIREPPRPRRRGWFRRADS
jgi:MerR family transcriptional regulator, heat shock protein HspR